MRDIKIIFAFFRFLLENTIYINDRNFRAPNVGSDEPDSK